MNWIVVTVFTIVFYSLFDLFLKLSSGKIHDYLNGFLINFIASIVLLMPLLWGISHGENVFQMKKEGLIFSVLAGIVIGLASIFFIRLFALGTNLSTAVPLVRIGMVVLGSILGIFVLKEHVDIRYLVGLVFSIIGFLLITLK